MTDRKALITEITGQDGSYLAEFLLAKRYKVHGLVRHVVLEDRAHRLDRLHGFDEQLILHSGSLESVVRSVMPDECYHLAAQSYGRRTQFPSAGISLAVLSASFEDDFSTVNTNVNGTHYTLAAVRELVPACRFYFAAVGIRIGSRRQRHERDIARDLKNLGAMPADRGARSRAHLG
jgi:GDPmannose 4,6-dehydratase